MKQNQLLVSRNDRLKAKRGELRPKPRAQYANQYWGMDMTKIRMPSGWWYLHVVKDWYSKEIIGFHFSATSRTEDWLYALNMAVNQRFPAGIRSCQFKPKLITDNGCQPAATRFIAATAALGIEQIFTSFNNPKGNADTERVMRTIKEDLVWIHEWQSPQQFHSEFKQWVHRYNNDYPHMALGWNTPTQFYKNTLLNAA